MIPSLLVDLPSSHKYLNGLHTTPYIQLVIVVLNVLGPESYLHNIHYLTHNYHHPHMLNLFNYFHFLLHQRLPPPNPQYTATTPLYYPIVTIIASPRSPEALTGGKSIGYRQKLLGDDTLSIQGEFQSRSQHKTSMLESQTTLPSLVRHWSHVCPT